MDLALSDEQKRLQESAERFAREKYTFDNRRKIVATERGWLPENWAQFAELGWLGMAFSEEDGGYGGGPIETMIVMEALGRNLVVEPYLDTVVLGGGFLYWAVLLMIGKDRRAPMETFRYSIVYLMALFIIMLVDHWLFPNPMSIVYPF